MKAMHAKEIELLKPAWLTALLLAAVPVWLLPEGFSKVPENIALVPFIFGVVMLSLSVFGREFGFNTFGLLLAQPVDRRCIWRAKVGWLAVAVLSVFVVWWASCAACLGTASRNFTGSEAFTFGAAACVVAFAGGLLTTLTLRQVAAPFWLTILVPGLIAMLMNEARTWQVLLVLGLYSAVCHGLARRQFLRAQDTAWMGEEVGLPRWLGAGTLSAVRKHRPWSALWRKELRLQQVALVAMAWIFLMHLGTVALRWMNYRAESGIVRTILETFGLLWIIVPFLSSSVSVAEERRLGTLGQQLGLPVSRRVQFGIKLLVTLGIGLLCALLICAIEALASAGGIGHPLFDREISRRDVKQLLLLFVGFSFIGFYASTLARNILQSMAAAVVTIVALAFFIGVAGHAGDILLLPGLWRGWLFYYLGLPGLFVALAWLAWRNFRSETGAAQLWRHNAAVLGTVLAGILILTSAIYNRAWELLSPVDRRPGIARITGAQPVSLGSYYGSALTAILPGGRLWMDRINYNQGRLVLSSGEESGVWLGGHWVSQLGNQIVPGSNWVRAVATFQDAAALRADGTLWILNKPRSAPSVALVPYGTETNWQDVVAHERFPSSVVLLKTDGTLWRLGTNSFSEKLPWPGLQSFPLRRLNSDSGWARILPGAEVLYAWKSDGAAWSIREPVKRERASDDQMEMVFERTPWLDHTKWLGVTRFSRFEVGLREDGTLWTWPVEWQLARTHKGGITTPSLRKIGTDSDWSQVAGDYGTLAARKTDGSIWRWNFPRWVSDFNWMDWRPVRLGSRNDWVGVARAWDGLLALSADGNLYYWWNRGNKSDDFQPMLTPSRRPELVENIFTISQ